MIVLSDFAISDMPKTGGSFARALMGISRGKGELKEKHIRFDVDVPTYFFLREPKDWYCSLISFLRYGSESDFGAICPIADALASHGILSSVSYLNVATGGDELTRDIIRKIKHADNNYCSCVIEWSKSEYVDLYSFMVSYFSRDAIILPFSELKNSLIALCAAHGQQMIEEFKERRVSKTKHKIDISEFSQKIESATHEAYLRANGKAYSFSRAV